MQAASCLSALFNLTTPDESPQPGLFELLEELLDLAEEFGRFPQFLYWAELRFADHHGHAPNLGNCTLCSATETPLFSAAAGGVICPACAEKAELPVFDCPPDILAILRAWQNADYPQRAVNTGITNRQQFQLSAISAAFMQHHFNFSPVHRPDLATILA